MQTERICNGLEKLALMNPKLGLTTATEVVGLVQSHYKKVLDELVFGNEMLEAGFQTLAAQTIPESKNGVDAATAAAAMGRGRRRDRVVMLRRPGHRAVIHAAAGPAGDMPAAELARRYAATILGINVPPSEDEDDDDDGRPGDRH